MRLVQVQSIFNACVSALELDLGAEVALPIAEIRDAIEPAKIATEKKIQVLNKQKMLFLTRHSKKDKEGKPLIRTMDDGATAYPVPLYGTDPDFDTANDAEDAAMAAVTDGDVEGIPDMAAEKYQIPKDKFHDKVKNGFILAELRSFTK